MNKNNLKRIAVFMAMIATFQSRLSAKNIMPVVAYGGPGLFGEQFKRNEEKKDKNNSSKIENKKFYQNPKFMFITSALGTSMLAGAALLLLWGTGFIGEKENTSDKYKHKKNKYKGIRNKLNSKFGTITEEEEPFNGYWGLVECLLDNKFNVILAQKRNNLTVFDLDDKEKKEVISSLVDFLDDEENAAKLEKVNLTVEERQQVESGGDCLLLKRRAKMGDGSLLMIQVYIDDSVSFNIKKKVGSKIVIRINRVRK